MVEGVESDSGVLRGRGFNLILVSLILFPFHLSILSPTQDALDDFLITLNTPEYPPHSPATSPDVSPLSLTPTKQLPTSRPLPLSLSPCLPAQAPPPSPSPLLLAHPEPRSQPQLVAPPPRPRPPSWTATRPPSSPLLHKPASTLPPLLQPRPALRSSLRPLRRLALAGPLTA